MTGYNISKEDARVLSKEEQEEIFTDWDNPENKEKFFKHNIKLVNYCIKKYINNNIDYDDLTQEASIGLWKAVQSFDPSKGVQFSSYAMKVINNEILMMLRDIRKRPYIDDKRLISMQTPIGTDTEGGSLYLEETISDEKEIDENYYGSEVLKAVTDFFNLKYKNHKYKDVIILSYKGKTQRHIADKLGISRSYVSRIILKFQKDFKKYYKSNYE